MFTVTAMDHIVLNVRDMDTMLDFYIKVLGLAGERIDDFHNGKVSFPSVRLNQDTLIDLFPSTSDESAPEPGKENLNHFCMVIEKTDMQAVIQHLESHGVEVEEGPGTRWGAHGNGTSIYFRDPRVASTMAPPPLEKPTEFTASEVALPPEAGRIYVFPAWLEHGVRPNRGREDRVGISFNVQAVARRS